MPASMFARADCRGHPVSWLDTGRSKEIRPHAREISGTPTTGRLARQRLFSSEHRGDADEGGVFGGQRVLHVGGVVGE